MVHTALKNIVIKKTIILNPKYKHIIDNQSQDQLGSNDLTKLLTELIDSILEDLKV